MPRRSPRASDPHTGHVPIRFRGSPYNLQAPKISTLVSTEPAFPAPQTRHPRASTNSLRRLPARCRMSGRGIKSAETSDRLAQIYAPDRLTQIPRAGEWGMGTASLRDATTAKALRSSRPEGRRLRPRAWIPEESGQVGFSKSPQTRRRIAQDGWQITQAAGQTRRHAGAWVRSLHFSTLSRIS